MTGFADGESTFDLQITKSKLYKLGWRIIPSFSIELHKKGFRILQKYPIFFFSIGSLRVRSRDGQIIYSVSSLEEIRNIIIAHFNKYPLNTQKRADFELWKLGIELLNKKENTAEWLAKFLAIKSTMNKGLSPALKTEFSNIMSVSRPSVILPDTLDPNWIAGFTDAEGCFHVQISNSKTTKTGKSVGLVFRIVQDSRDALLIAKLGKQLGCGN